MAESKSWRTQYGVRVASGLTVAAVVAFAAWAWQYSPVAWAWIGSMAVAAWSFVTLPVPVPVWLLVTIILGTYFVPRWIAGALKETTPEPPVPSTLNDRERHMVRAIASGDGDLMTIDQIADRANTSRLLAEQQLEALYKRGIVDFHGGGFRLTSAGRDLAIAAGDAPTSRSQIYGRL